MSNGDTKLSYRWEWPADRTPDTRLLARVTKIENQREGLFGITRSPSIAANLPDPLTLTGIIIDGNEKFAHQEFTLTLPKIEAASISANDYVALGVIHNDTCICIEKIPGSEDRVNQMKWLANWKCSKK